MAGNKTRNDAIMEEADTHDVDQTLIPPEEMDVQTATATADADEPQFEIPLREPGQAETLLRDLEEQKRKATEHLDMALRAQAELDNTRKRAARDIENAYKYGLDRFVNELLPVMDSMELGFSATGSAAEVAGLRTGMELTLKMFSGVLEKFGIKALDPQGLKFDPGQHQAVSMIEQPGTPAGTVISVMQKGYELNGRLVRPAMVVVAK